MSCVECGRESSAELGCCPHCGSGSSGLPARINFQSSASESEAQVGSQTDSLAGQGSIPAAKVQVGTVVFGAFSAITFIAAAIRGFPLISLLETAGWAGFAWYWQSKKTHTEAAKVVVVVLAVLVGVGEMSTIASRAALESKPVTTAGDGPAQPNILDSGVQFAAHDQLVKQAGVDQGILTTAAKAFPPGYSIVCPKSLPSGTNSKSLPTKEASSVVGKEGSIQSEKTFDYQDSLVWDAMLSYSNKTDDCITMAAVELNLMHGGVASKERHNIVFQPLLSPGDGAGVEVKLKIKTTERSDDVALLGWRTVSAYGYKP